jgi:hypothetical protein
MIGTVWSRWKKLSDLNKTTIYFSTTRFVKNARHMLFAKIAAILRLKIRWLSKHGVSNRLTIFRLIDACLKKCLYTQKSDPDTQFASRFQGCCLALNDAGNNHEPTGGNMHFKKLFDNAKKDRPAARQNILTPEELHHRAEALWAALRANAHRATHEGQQPLPNVELLYRLMNLVEIIIGNNKQGRNGFDCGEPQSSRDSEFEVFKSVRHALERHLGWHLAMPLSPEEQAIENDKQAIRESLVNDSRRRYGRLITKDELEALDITDEDIAWLRRYGLRPE